MFLFPVFHGFRGFGAVRVIWCFMLYSVMNLSWVLGLKTEQPPSRGVPSRSGRGSTQSSPSRKRKGPKSQAIAFVGNPDRLLVCFVVLLLFVGGVCFKIS